MSKAHGQIRRSQVITTWGPGALIDLPRHSAIVGGLEGWGNLTTLEEIKEPRLSAKLETLTGIPSPRLFAPPIDDPRPAAPTQGIVVWQFPGWFLEQSSAGEEVRSRRLVHSKALDDKGRVDGSAVVPLRFVRACPRGHIDDIDWYGFVHGPEDSCRLPLTLVEQGTTGDLGDLTVRCECGKSRGLYEATVLDERPPLGWCTGARPWLGPHQREMCNQPSRLLIRTAANAYFPQIVSVLSLPERGSALESAVGSVLEQLRVVEEAADLRICRRDERVQQALRPFQDGEVFATLLALRRGNDDRNRPVKLAELDALLAAPEGYGEDVPPELRFHARRLPDAAWRRSSRSDGIASVIQLHRLREVLALVGFTRFEAQTPDILGEFDTDVVRAELAAEPSWFPAVENRGEGLFVQLRSEAVAAWLERPGVRTRVDQLAQGYGQWQRERNSERPFPGGPYVLLHTLSHLLLQSLAMRCGYPASSLRERIYVDPAAQRYGFLLYTASPDAEGTLGGLVQQARHLEDHLAHALRHAALCSNDPICAQHSPTSPLEGRALQGAACHACTYLAETSCEMRNDLLDRGLVVAVVGDGGGAFFGG